MCKAISFVIPSKFVAFSVIEIYCSHTVGQGQRGGVDEFSLCPENWEYLIEMLFNSTPWSARERLLWPCLLQFLILWDISKQTSSFSLVGLTVPLKQD